MSMGTSERFCPKINVRIFVILYHLRPRLLLGVRGLSVNNVPSAYVQKVRSWNCYAQWVTSSTMGNGVQKVRGPGL